MTKICLLMAHILMYLASLLVLSLSAGSIFSSLNVKILVSSWHYVLLLQLKYAIFWICLTCEISEDSVCAFADNSTSSFWSFSVDCTAIENQANSMKNACHEVVFHLLYPWSAEHHVACDAVITLFCWAIKVKYTNSRPHKWIYVILVLIFMHKYETLTIVWG